ncbi:hypothetical protein [Chitinophaga sp. HK235]|uniref:hypothetical protein n=1 Tax=Chitinophaga sp. HK235 TaxID=2952571 RepID=UPI001BACA7F6|nr:hypothetical protein [Chitinophaga sp. HK235]
MNQILIGALSGALGGISVTIVSFSLPLLKDRFFENRRTRTAVLRNLISVGPLDTYEEESPLKDL